MDAGEKKWALMKQIFKVWFTQRICMRNFMASQFKSDIQI